LKGIREAVDPVGHDLTAEAIRRTRLIHALMPEDGEVAGLLALLLLTEARRTDRVSASGELAEGLSHPSPRPLG
jgi:RNA polymerase sigma-70 factor (ECF subfamily)